MSKKILSVLIACILFAFSFTACSSNEQTDEKENKTTSSATAAVQNGEDNQFEEQKEDNKEYDLSDYASDVKMMLPEGYTYYVDGAAYILNNTESVILFTRNFASANNDLAEFLPYLRLYLKREITCVTEKMDLSVVGQTKIHGVEAKEFSGTVTDNYDKVYAVKGYLFNSNGENCVALTVDLNSSAEISEGTANGFKWFVDNMSISA